MIAGVFGVTCLLVLVGLFVYGFAASMTTGSDRVLVTAKGERCFVDYRYRTPRDDCEYTIITRSGDVFIVNGPKSSSPAGRADYDDFVECSIYEITYRGFESSREITSASLVESDKAWTPTCAEPEVISLTALATAFA